jgi:pimeloyl-ACP methyl ester carboxylesterase
MEMNILKIIAFGIVFLYLAIGMLLYFFQTKLLFYPDKLKADFKFKQGEEIFLKTADDEQINALFFRGDRPEVILYFHGNAGDLRGWQFVAEDFTQHGYSFLIIDYRGYGKSSGKISEEGFYKDAEAAYFHLVNKKGFTPQSILVYGRSIGSGVAVNLASKYRVQGLVLESPYASLGLLAKEKLPFFFPSLYLKHKFNSLEKINLVKSPVVFIHGQKDTLIPPSHTEKLFEKFTGKKQKILVPKGSHNDLNEFKEYQAFLSGEMGSFF